MDWNQTVDYFRTRFEIEKALPAEADNTPVTAAQMWEHKINPSSAARRRFLSALAGRDISTFKQLDGTEIRGLSNLIDDYAEELRVAVRDNYAVLVPRSCKNRHTTKASQRRRMVPAMQG